MLEGFIGGLFTAWFLKLFGVNNMFINVLQPFFANIKLTTDHYYFSFGILGMITWIMIVRK